MSLEKFAESMRKVALAYPETYEEQPWGGRVVKVRGKIFFFCGVHDKLIYATVKAPKPKPKKTPAKTVDKNVKEVKAAGKALLVCADKLRAERAVKAFGASGIAVDVIEDAGKVKLGKARALIVDIGRNPVEGLAL